MKSVLTILGLSLMSSSAFAQLPHPYNCSDKIQIMVQMPRASEPRLNAMEIRSLNALWSQVENGGSFEVVDATTAVRATGQQWMNVKVIQNASGAQKENAKQTLDQLNAIRGVMVRCIL